MALQISAENLRKYRHTAKMRYLADRAQRDVRWQRAWQLARQAAALLKEEYGVDRVVAFGSLTHSGRFTRWSDVDLAAWGLTPDNWLHAIGAVRALSDEIDINLVDMTCCSPELAVSILRDEVLL